uniref:ZAD domain-containing protein n=1 Tax=Anopheles atroparvus TaxID=41427 RepID=A0AAG5CQ36_ANOAO
MEELSSARCRLCFQKKFQLLPMFPANEPVNDDLLRKIQDCVAVSIVYEDDQNSMICIKCIVDVEQFYGFKERCMQNELLWQQIRQENCPQQMDQEEEFDSVDLPDMQLMEPTTTLHHTDQPTTFMEAFLGLTKLLRIGYNYRVVRVNDARNVLIYRKHRYYQPDEKADCNNWVCIAKEVTDCPAKLMISSTASYPLAIFNRRVKHNHSEATVRTVGLIDSYSEEIVKVLQKYTLAVDSKQRLRLLAGGYRYRLQQALRFDGMSSWVCERSKSDSCPASVMLSYEDEKAFLEGGQSHTHFVEDSVPVPSAVNGALIAQQKQQKNVTYQLGYNYKITDGILLFRGNLFKPGKPNSSSGSSSVWNCIEGRCAVRLKIRQKIATLMNREHQHPPATSKEPHRLTQETLQQGVNYRLILDETGDIRLLYRKRKFTLDTMRKNGTTQWACAWQPMGCKAVLQMVPDEQVVYGCADTDHHHRVGNVLEQYFLPTTPNNTPPSQETVLWSSEEYELLWNRNSKPILLRNNARFYARKASKNGTVQWHCTSGVRTCCEASITIDKDGKIIHEAPSHDHQRLCKTAPQTTPTTEGKLSTAAIFDSPGPVHLLAGGFNYRRMLNVQLNVEIIAYCAHRYLVDDAPNTYHCIMRDAPECCQGKIILTNNALCAELCVPHNHSARGIRRLAQPDRSAQVTVEGPNYELIYSMSGRNCLLVHDGYAFRMYKLLEPIQCSRWRCVHGEAGCKAYLNVPLSLEKPASTNGHPHDHSMVFSRTLRDSEDTTISQELCSVVVKVEEPPEHDTQQQITNVENVVPSARGLRNARNAPLMPFPRVITVKRELPIDVPLIDPNAMTDFQNGHLYVRKLEGSASAENENAEMVCAFHWTLNCPAATWDQAHNHERFASVRTNDRFNMLKVLISRGIIAHRGPIMLTQPVQSVSEYELMPSNGNLSLIIDNHRYNFYKAKNNGDWLWRCVRHRWQGCKIGVAVSHCFGKYFFQPYGTKEHEHSPEQVETIN